MHVVVKLLHVAAGQAAIVGLRVQLVALTQFVPDAQEHAGF